MSRSSPSSPREPPSLSLPFSEEPAHGVKAHSKLTLSEEMHLRAKKGLEPSLAFLSFLGGDTLKLSPRAALGLGLALCLAAAWASSGAWQAKCCQCARVQRAKASQGAQRDKDKDRPRNFVYVYDLGTAFTDDVQRLEPWWYSERYDVERQVSELLLSSNAVRTTNPEQASLFFIPFFSARFTLYGFRETELNMARAVRNTSRVWMRILKRVRGEYPFFNRTRGRDHFGVLAMDQGRCSALTFVPPSLYGDMFFITLNGDRLTRSIHAHPKVNLHFLSYSYDRPAQVSKGGGSELTLPDISCYKPGHDIVVPAFAKLPIAPPAGAPRDIRVLFQFWSRGPKGVPMVHHGHDVTQELLRLFQGVHAEAWELGEQGQAEAAEDLRRATLCVVAPGLGQWSSLFPKAVLSGCLPVTFWRENDNPWQDELDYSAFSLNVDLDELDTLAPLLQALLLSPQRLQRMQIVLAQVQQNFSWSGSFEQGAEAMLLRRLEKRALEMRAFQEHARENTLLLSGEGEPVAGRGGAEAQAA